MSVTVNLPEVILEINDTLLAGETNTEEYTPEAGKTVTVLTYFAEIPFSEEVVSCLGWDGNAEWSIRESGHMPFIKTFVGDGVKKLEVQMHNVNASSPQAVSARVVLDVR